MISGGCLQDWVWTFSRVCLSRRFSAQFTTTQKSPESPGEGGVRQTEAGSNLFILLQCFCLACPSVSSVCVCVCVCVCVSPLFHPWIFVFFVFFILFLLPVRNVTNTPTRSLSILWRISCCFLTAAPLDFLLTVY